MEGALYAGGKDGKVNVHFTVSPEHRPLFESLVADKAIEYSKKFNVAYSVSFSEQKSSTDTVAATPDTSHSAQRTARFSSAQVVTVRSSRTSTTSMLTSSSSRTLTTSFLTVSRTRL